MAKRPLGSWVLPINSPPKRLPGLTGAQSRPRLTAMARPDAVDLADLRSLDEVAQGPDAALAEVPRVAVLDQGLLAPFDGPHQLQPEACLSQIGAALSHQFLCQATLHRHG